MERLVFAAPTKEWYAEKVLTGEDYVIADSVSPEKRGIKDLEVKGNFSKKIWVFIGAEGKSRMHLIANNSCSFVGQIVVDPNERVSFRVGMDFDGGGEIVMRGNLL